MDLNFSFDDLLEYPEASQSSIAVSAEQPSAQDGGDWCADPMGFDYEALVADILEPQTAEQSITTLPAQEPALAIVGPSLGVFSDEFRHHRPLESGLLTQPVHQIDVDQQDMPELALPGAATGYPLSFAQPDHMVHPGAYLHPQPSPYAFPPASAHPYYVSDPFGLSYPINAGAGSSYTALSYPTIFLPTGSASIAPMTDAPALAAQWLTHDRASASTGAPGSEYFDTRPLSSSDSSASPPNAAPKEVGAVNTKKYFGEKPTIPEGKPWIRKNATTEGKTSRTGKINHYDPDEMYSRLPHPTGTWQTRGGKDFRYNKWHELAKSELPSNMIKDFIYQHPKTKDCKLTLYIQRAPADSKRRYPTSTLDKCRFKECPMRTYSNKGNIMHGHYRVAFDETSYKQGPKAGEICDPFLTAGYVHLYCLERFLDFPDICNLDNINVTADARQLSKEPNGSFAAALGGNEHRIAVNFIQAARSRNIRQHPSWTNYPTHVEDRDKNGRRIVAPKNHKMTLNYALQTVKNQNRSSRVMNNTKVSTVAVHRGDLEIYCRGRKKLLSQQEIDTIYAGLNDSVSEAAPANPVGQRRSPRIADGKRTMPVFEEDAEGEIEAGPSRPTKRSRAAEPDGDVSPMSL